MQRQNLLSITGRNIDVPIDDWIMQYVSGREVPALAEAPGNRGRVP
jgi:hypothetical protein